MAKERHEVIIMGRKYVVIGEETDGDFIKEVANLVDNMMTSIRKKNPVLSKESAAILTAINAVAEKMKSVDPEEVEIENEELKQEIMELKEKYNALEDKFAESQKVIDEKAIIELTDSLENSKSLNIDLRGEVEDKEREIIEIKAKRQELEERLLESETELLFAQKELRNRR